jgi:type IV secretory pathway TrbD component
MVLTAGLAACLGVIAWFTWSVLALVAGIFVMASCVPLLRKLANRDPMMVAVSTRFISYKKYYPARTPVSPWKG